MSSNPARISNWKLERFALNELPPHEMEFLRKQIAENPALQDQLDALRQSDALFLEQHPPKSAARRILAMAGSRQEENLRQDQPWFTSFLSLPKGMLAALLIVAVTVLVLQTQYTETDIRTKGGDARIELWQKNGDSISMILDSAILQAGDLVQIRIHPTERCYGVVISLDGRGNWTTHMPDTGYTSPMIEPGKNEFLPFSYQLDDAPQFEVFWLVMSSKPFQVTTLLQSLDILRNSPMAPPVLPLNADFTQVRIGIRK